MKPLSQLKQGIPGIDLELLDSKLMWIAPVLLLLGWLMISTASTGIAEHYTNNPMYFSIRHVIYMFLGVGVLVVGVHIPMSFWQRIDAFLLLIGIVVLIMVLVPGIGHEVNGSRRWLNLGIIKIQASEIAKLAVILYVAGYLVRRQEQVQQSWGGFLRPLLIMSLVILLLLSEPDFGAVVVLMGAVLAQLFLGGVKAGQFFLLVIGAFLLSYLVLTSESYRVQRLMAYLDPWAPEYVFNSGYQLAQSLIAFGRGGLFGVGLGESVQKLFYLPEAHTDFVFAIWAEETGLFGALLALTVLVALVVKGLQIAWNAQEKLHMYGAYVAIGISILFSLQIVINLGVNTGLLPTKGLTLPFYSYGGSSLLICCLMLGILVRIEYESKQLPENKSAKIDSKRRRAN